MKPPPIQAVKPGDIITFVYGPGDRPAPEFAQHVGKAYGFRRNARWGDTLRVKMPDGKFEHVEQFTAVGIGAYYWGKGAA